jgi:NAD(P)-dependent dehydrogenase (short-subunit alcohol dehydrogenase family)
MSKGRLHDKVAIVTGAGSVGAGWGNGRATAVLFAREGAHVLIVDNNVSAAQETARAVQEGGGVCAVCEANVVDEISVNRMVEECIRRFGRIDVLHNNVGGSIPGGPVEMSVQEFRDQLDVNLTSVFLTSKAVLPHMEKRGSGVITNVGSVSGLRHMGHDNIGYASAKSGLIQFSRQLAVRYGKNGIRCNTIIPGLIDTPLLEHRVAKQAGRADLATLKGEAIRRVPLGRRGDAWDIAYAAVFLASEEAKYISGAEILVDGGLVARSA